VCVCACVCPVCALTFESLDLENFVFGTQVHFQNLSVKVECQLSRSWGQGHGLTSVTKCTHSRVVCLRWKGNFVYWNVGILWS